MESREARLVCFMPWDYSDDPSQGWVKIVGARAFRRVYNLAETNRRHFEVTWLASLYACGDCHGAQWTVGSVASLSLFTSKHPRLVYYAENYRSPPMVTVCARHSTSDPPLSQSRQRWQINDRRCHGDRAIDQPIKRLCSYSYSSLVLWSINTPTSD